MTVKFTVPRIVSRNWSHRKKVRAKKTARILERTIAESNFEEATMRAVQTYMLAGQSVVLVTFDEAKQILECSEVPNYTAADVERDMAGGVKAMAKGVMVFDESAPILREQWDRLRDEASEKVAEAMRIPPELLSG